MLNLRIFFIFAKKVKTNKMKNKVNIYIFWFLNVFCKIPDFFKKFDFKSCVKYLIINFSQSNEKLKI